MHILIKYASRSRPEKFFEGLHNIIDMAADKVNFTVFCCLDKDDLTIDDAFRERTKDEKFDHAIFDYGYSKSKIHAINRPIPDHLQWDILVNFSDDMRFTVYGWDELVREGFRCNGPDKFLHFPDSTAKNMLCTMTIIDRAYFDRDGYVYHSAYKSLWADNHAQDVAKIRGCYVYMGTQIFDHYHPAYGMAQWDALYHLGQSFWTEDEISYLYFKSKNFFLDANGNTIVNTDSNH